MNTESIIQLLVELFGKSVAITLFAVLLARIWRGATAAQRHFVGVAALATITLLPLTRLVAPRWAIALQPAHKVTVTMPALSPVPLEKVETESVPLETVAPAVVHTPVDWRRVVLGCWLAGTMLVLAHRLVGSWRLRRLLNSSLPLDDGRVGAMATRIFAELGIRRLPDLRLSAECRVPITWGVLRPRMLLPMAALEWSDAWIVAALRHESAHIRRHDYFARWLAHLACAIYWPNPFVWLLARSLRLAQEQAADDLVLRAGTPAEEYATQLVEAARMVAANGFFVRQAVAMACPSTLEHRVRAIVDGRSKRHPLSVLAASLGSLAAVVVLGLCAVAQLRSEDGAASEGSSAREERAPIVLIKAKFLDIDAEVLKKDPAVKVDEETRIFSDPQFQMIMRALGQEPSVRLLSIPLITTESKQRAQVQVNREFRYAKDWEKGPEGWKGTAFETKNIGITLDATPEVQADGTIVLKLKAEVIDVAGFRDLDNPDPSSSATDAEHLRMLPIFSQAKIEQTATLKTGETVLLTQLKRRDGEPSSGSKQPGRLYVFVTASIAGRAPQKDGEAQTRSARPQSDVTQQAQVAELEAQLRILNELHPEQLGEALKLLKIDDATMTRNLPLLQDAIAEDARLAGLGLGEDDPRRKTLRAQEATYRKILSDQLATLQYTQKERVLQAKEKLAPAGNAAGASATKLVTKEWKVPPDLIPPKPGGDGAERQSTKDWLMANGVQFGGNSTAIYVAATNRLMVRNTPEELDRIDQLVARKIAGSTTAPEATPAPAPLWQAYGLVRLEKIIIPKIELREATVTEAFNFLRAKAKECDPEKTGVNIVMKPGIPSDARITVSLTNIPLVEALRYFTGLANLEYEVQPNAIVVHPAGAKTDASDGAPAALPVASSEAPQEGSAMTKAKTIIFPKIEFREATLPEILEFLRLKSKELDPEKTGVNFVVKPGATSEAKITLSLTNIPLLEAVHYVVSLANLEYEVQPNAIVIQRVPANIQMDGGKLEFRQGSPQSANPAKSVEQEAAHASGTVTPGGATTYTGTTTISAPSKANTIIIPKFELRQASLTEALDFLRMKAKELDPEKTGVNIVLKPGTSSEAKITLSLTDIPLLEALKYVTGLVDFELQVQPDALVVQPRLEKKTAAAPVPESGSGKAKDDGEPVEITADTTHFDDNVAVAKGNACLKYGGQTMKADLIRYDPATRQVDLTGKVEIKNNTSVLQAERVTLWLTPDGQMKIEGPHKVNLLAPPVDTPKATVDATPDADLRRQDRGMPHEPAAEAQAEVAADRQIKKIEEHLKDAGHAGTAQRPNVPFDVQGDKLAVRVTPEAVGFDPVRGESVFVGGARVAVEKQEQAPSVHAAGSVNASVPKVEVTADSVSFDAEKGESVFSGDARIKINRPDGTPLVFKANELVVQPEMKNTDAGDLFLAAYMALKQSEKLEANGQIAEAVVKLQLAGKKLEEVAKQYPTWQPQIVEYRTARIAEALQRLQGKP